MYNLMCYILFDNILLGLNGNGSYIINEWWLKKDELNNFYYSLLYYILFIYN